MSLQLISLAVETAIKVLLKRITFNNSNNKFLYITKRKILYFKIKSRDLINNREIRFKILISKILITVKKYKN
jgi:hypothetical protein